MNINEKSVVVTGSADFIGSSLIDSLLKHGTGVVGIDFLFNGKIDNLDVAFKQNKFEFHKGDLRDLNFLLDVFEDIDIVYHEAVFTSVPQSVKMPENCNNVNVNGT